MSVVLDPGHGGTYRIGGSSPNNAVGPTGLLEKAVTLDVALRTRDLLSRGGVSVRLTRDSDVNLGLEDRARVGKSNAAAVYVSIHFNGWNGVVQGTETYVHKNASVTSQSLAKLVQFQVRAATGYSDRGVKRAGFGTLNPRFHHQSTAACLVEISFMDVPEEEIRLRDSAYLDRLAAALHAAIMQYLNGVAAFNALVETNADDPEDGYELLVR